MPPKGTRGKKGKGKAGCPMPEGLNNSSQSQHQRRQMTATPPRKQRENKKTVTAFSEQQKEEIIEFLKSNEVHGQSGCINTR